MFGCKSIRALCSIKRVDLILSRYDKTSMSRHFSTSLHYLTENKNPSSKNPWNRIYIFPQIRIVGALSRLKIYQTALTIIGVPLGISMYNSGLAELSAVEYALGCSLLATATLYMITSFLRKVIGIVSVSDDNKQVQVSHLTFWGRRNDVVVPTEDVVPLIEGGCRPGDVFVKFRRYSSEDALYLTLKYGKILDKERFQEVFGSLDIFKD